jgi:hypothetical protein
MLYFSCGLMGYDTMNVILEVVETLKMEMIDSSHLQIRYIAT